MNKNLVLRVFFILLCKKIVPMRPELKSIIEKKFGTDNLLFTEYNTSAEIEKKEIEFSKVRGNVRLFIEHIITRGDLIRYINKVLSVKLR